MNYSMEFTELLLKVMSLHYTSVDSLDLGVQG